MRKWILAAAVALLVGGGVAFADDTTGTNVSCATATVPAQTIAVNGSDVYTVPENDQTTCNTTTYTIPTETETDTVDTATVTAPAVTETVTTPPVTVTQTITQTTTTPTTTTSTTGTTTTPPPPPPAGCFASPGACGYPDPSYVSATGWTSGGSGVGPQFGGASEPCSSLTASGSITTSSAGQVISNVNVTGTITVNKANVTIQNVCVTENGGAALGSSAIKVTSSGTTIEDSTISGANDSKQSVEVGVLNFGGSSNVVTMSHDYVFNCGECLNTGSWNVSDSYILNNGMYDTGDHLEAVYIDGAGNTATFNHDTVLSPPGWDGSGSPFGGQAGLFFGDTNGGSGGACSTKWTVTNNLLAGDGVLLYQCGNASSVGSSSLTFTGNDIARCLGSTGVVDGYEYYCTDIPQQTGADTNRGGDGHGYFPLGGSKGTDLDTYCTASTTTWSGNYWDDNGVAVAC